MTLIEIIVPESDRHEFKCTKLGFKLQIIPHIGMEVIDDEVIIAFSYQDNCSYAIKTSKEFINDFIWTQSKPSYLHS